MKICRCKKWSPSDPFHLRACLTEFLVAGQCGGKTEEGEEVAAFAFVPHGEAAVAEQPGDGSLDLPPVPSQALGRLDARTRDPRGDAAPAQPGQGLSGMAGLVAAELARAPAPRPAPERTAGIALTSGASAWLSWTLAAGTPTASGTPWASDSTCSLLPGLPRSTGFGPVSEPPFSPTPTRRR